MVTWNATKDELTLIGQIADRAIELANHDGNGSFTKMDLMMDIEAAHCNGTPLDLDALFTAPNGDFVHDIWGIRRHMNRETGELMDCFLPRCSKRV